MFAIGEFTGDVCMFSTQLSLASMQAIRLMSNVYVCRPRAYGQLVEYCTNCMVHYAFKFVCSPVQLMDTFEEAKQKYLVLCLAAKTSVRLTKDKAVLMFNKRLHHTRYSVHNKQFNQQSQATSKFTQFMNNNVLILL